MASAITRTTIESNAYNDIYSILNTRSNIADPKDPGGVRNRDFILNSDPYTDSLKFDGYPYLFITFPTIEYSSVSADGKHKDIGWKHRIVVRTARDGATSGTTPMGFLNMQAICDDLHETFNSTTIVNQLKLLNIEKPMLEKIGADTTNIEGKGVYEAEYELTYETRLQVST